MATTSDSDTISTYPSPLPLWLDPVNAKQIVRGNFMILSSRPTTVEQGEWIAHQTVEHYRLLWNFVHVILEKEDDGSVICACPKMSAGEDYSYNFSRPDSTKVLGSEEAELSAHEYIILVHQWISNKIDDPKTFPTHPSTVSHAYNSVSTTDSDDWIGKRSGFPKNFINICRAIFRQMFRIYAHLYWNHFIEPFYHLSLEGGLNSSFSHFLFTAISLDMLSSSDLKPMQCFIDLLAANGSLPPGSKAYELANIKYGAQLLHLNVD